MHKAVAVLAAAWVLAAGGQAMAQTAPAPPPRAKMEPTPMLLQTVCIPYLTGQTPEAIRDRMIKHGFVQQISGDKVFGLLTPPALRSQGWLGTYFNAASCDVKILWLVESPFAYLEADIAKWLRAAAPGGPYTAKASASQDGEPGKATRVRVWESPVYVVQLVEMREDTVSEMEGKLALDLTVSIRKK